MLVALSHSTFGLIEKSMNPNEVSVVILNFNGMKSDYLPNCLQSLTQQTHAPLQVIVVDNASDDDSVRYVQQNFPHVWLIANPRNEGFCTGNNIGYEWVTGEYVLFANNDTIFQPMAIAHLIQAARTSHTIGMVAPKMIRPHSSDIGVQFLDSTGLLLRNDLTLRDRGFEEIDVGQFEHPVHLFGCCGAAFFARSKALESILDEKGRLWDEAFFAYYEDGDLSWRLQNRGWHCLYCPEAIVTHFRGASSPPAFFNKPRKFKIHTIKNRYLMIVKNVSCRLVLRNLPFILFREFLIWGYLLLHPRLLVDVLKALKNTLPYSWKTRIKSGIRADANFLKSSVY